MTEPTKTARPAKSRDEGQWALGHREPLNANEQIKKDDDPLNVRARIENIYAKHGFDSIDKSDLRGRFRWWGLYTQRKPGYDGTWTGDENTDMLEDEYFMLRVRSDGGALTRRGAAHARRRSRPSSPATPPTSPTARTCSTTGSGSRTCRRSGGVSTRSACRPPRPAATAPASCSAPRWPVSRSTRSSTAHRRSTRSSALHRQARVLQPAAQVQDRDLAACRTWCTRSTTSRSSASTTPSTVPVSTCGSAAGCRPTRCWPSGSAPGCRSTRCPTSGKAVVSVFRDYGYRRLRAKARLKFLIKDWGVEKFREVLETEYLKRPLIDGPAPEPVVRPIDHVGVQRLKNGLNAVGVSPDRGPGLGHDPEQGRRPRRAGRLGPDPVHARTRSWSSSTSPTTNSTR